MDDTYEPLLEGEAALALPAAPYPGLRPFEKTEWAIFFGRETMTEGVIARLVDRHLVAIHGDSGCGKSSLVRAGVLPVLEMDHARVGGSWKTVVMRPEDSPLSNLAQALAAGDASRVDAFRNIVTHGENAARPLAEMLGCSAEHNVCILLDQFEELFEHARKHGPLEAEIITAFLSGLLRDKPAGLHAIITMRSDYLGQCAHYRGFAETVNETQYLVPRMERPALWRAVREPAALYGGKVEPGLVDRLIADAGGGQDQLPLIQHGLMLLWRNKTGGDAAAEGWALDVQDYSQRGGLTDLLSEHADAAMAIAAPNEDDKRVLEAVFRALTDRNADRQAIRRPQTFAELCAVSGAEPGRLQGILRPFRAADASFLRPYGEEPLAPRTRIDISHEAFIRNWKRLADPERGWLAQEADDGLRWAALKLSARGFAKDRTEILSPAMAEESSALIARTNPVWAGRHGGAWDQIGALVAASRRSVQLRRRRIRFWMNVAVAATAVVMAGLAAFAVYQAQLAQEQGVLAERAAEEARQAALVAEKAAHEAEEARRIAEAQERAAMEAALAAEAEKRRAEAALADAAVEAERALRSETVGLAALAQAELSAGRPVEALKLALAAWPRANDPQKRAQLRLTLSALSDILPNVHELTRATTDGSVLAVVVTAEGHLVLASRDGLISKWDVRSGTQIAGSRIAPSIDAVSISADGTRAAVAGGAAVTVLSTETGDLEFVVPVDDPVAFRFSPDNARIATASAAGIITLWDAKTGKQLAIADVSAEPAYLGSRIDTLAFSPDGQKLAMGLVGGVAVGIRSGTTLAADNFFAFSSGFAPEQQGVKAGADVLAMAYSRSGKRLLTVSTDNQVRFWDPSAGVQLWSFSSSGTSPSTAAFLADDRFAVVGAADGKLTLLDVDNQRVSRTYSGHQARVNDVIVTPDGTAIISTADDSTLRSWSLPRIRTTLELRGHERAIVSVSFSRDDTRLATASFDRTARIWDATNGANLQTLSGALLGFVDIAFSPDGSEVVTAAEEPTAIVWDTTSGKQIKTLEGQGKLVRSVQYSPDGERIVAAGDDGITIWSASEGRAQLRFGRGYGEAYHAEFSPDGSAVLTASGSIAAVWDSATGKQRTRFQGISGSTFWGAFSFDGKQAVLLGNEGAAIRDVASGQQVAELFQGGPLSYAISFSHDGSRLVGGSRSQTAEIFDVATGVAIETLEGHEREVYFATYSTSDRLVATASEDRLALVWDVSGVEPGSAFDIACARLGKNAGLADVEQRYGLRGLAPVCGDNPPLPVDWATLE